MLPKYQGQVRSKTLPVSKKKISYQPFSVREEKILLMAAESREQTEMMDAFKQVISNCIIEDIKVGGLPIYDLEYLFVLIRSVAVNDIATFQIVDEDGIVEVSLDLRKALDEAAEKIIIPDKKLQLADNLGVIMGDMTFDLFAKTIEEGANKSETENIMSTLARMIEKIYDADKVYDTSEYKIEEVMEFIDSLPPSAMQILQDYVNSVPTLTMTIPYKNKSGEEKEFKLQGLNDFFQYV